MVEDGSPSSLRKRIERVAARVQSKWKDALATFGQGMLSGFLSNLVTMVWNMFATTYKNAVRMIREGFASFLKALHFFVFPPEHLSIAQAAHEATILIAGGSVAVAGIALEEVVKNTVVGVPFAHLLVPVVVGIITGVATTTVVSLVDKLDLFGVNFDERHDFVVGALNDRIEAHLESADEAFEVFDSILPEPS
jgi:hypothetical protein